MLSELNRSSVQSEKLAFAEAMTLQATDSADDAGATMGSWLASDTDALQLDARFDTPGPADALPFCIRVIRGIRG
jgi:hypothetical protein